MPGLQSQFVRIRPSPRHQFQWNRTKRYYSVKKIGIRREDKNQWERRVCISPQHVEKLMKETDVEVTVQPSNLRIFTDYQYEKAGAIIEEDLSKVDTILGVKEVPIEKLLKEKTYFMFSHTHKAQEYNMPLLQNILDKDIRLIDYELMKQDGKRVVMFGKFAGYAGFVDLVHGFGKRLLSLGFGTPFVHMGMAHTYSDIQSAREALKKLGDIIQQNGLPRALGPTTFVFTGSGNVSKGALSMFEQLPHRYVTVDELQQLHKSQNFNNHIVYGCKLKCQDYLMSTDGRPFDYSNYLKKPKLYQSIFHEKILPYTTVLINGAYWDQQYPRLLTTKQLRDFQQSNEANTKLISIADISCDINGSLEFMSKASTIDDPFFYADALSNSTHSNLQKPGVQIMSIDNLPTEFPLESTLYFSEKLYPYLKEYVLGNSKVINDAIICESSQLKPEFNHLKPFLPQKNENIQVKGPRKILILGSGLVARPLVEHLAQNPKYEITIASNKLDEAQSLQIGKPNVKVSLLDIRNTRELEEFIQQHHISVSIVPAALHPLIAKLCVSNQKHLVTASYVSEEMKALDQSAKSSGVLLLNEIGLDPGIDHLTAMKIIDEEKDKGNRITSFISWCGGLPAPENSNNPLAYKFSWSPLGVLNASKNPAKFLLNGKVIDIPGQNLLASHFPNLPIFPGFSFEGLANRNSLKYIETYGLNQEYLKTMFRGTLRYHGFSDLMFAFRKLGFLNPDVNLKSGQDFGQFFDTVIGCKGQPDSRLNLVATRLELPPSHPFVIRVNDSLQWLSESTHSLPANISILDSFCLILTQKLNYLENERDLVALHHEFEVTGEEGVKTITSSLVEYGRPDVSAMAYTVGVPVAIATDLILQDKINLRGVWTPTVKGIYQPILNSLTALNLRFFEGSRKGPGMSSQLTWQGSGIWNNN